jgi:transcriptional regulator with XRE-family HTH domain
MKKVKILKQRSATNYDLELGKLIRIRRVEVGMSQDSLGEKLGVSFQQVQKYEKGVNRVGAGRLAQIAATLEVPVTFFYDGKSKGEIEVQSLLSIDSHFSVRMLRAWTAIADTALRRQFVALMETVANSGPVSEG